MENTDTMEHIRIAVCSIMPRDQVQAVIEVISGINDLYRPEYVSIGNHLKHPPDLSQYDGMLLVHSTNVGRFSITDVPDSRFTVFLSKVCAVFGKFYIFIYAITIIIIIIIIIKDNIHYYN